MNDELAARILEEFVASRPKMYSYLTGDGYVDKKAKGRLQNVSGE